MWFMCFRLQQVFSSPQALLENVHVEQVEHMLQQNNICKDSSAEHQIMKNIVPCWRTAPHVLDENVGQQTC